MGPATVRLGAGLEPNLGPCFYVPHARQPQHRVEKHRQREEGIGQIIRPPTLTATASTTARRGRRRMFVLGMIEEDETKVANCKGQHIEPRPWPPLGKRKEAIVMLGPAHGCRMQLARPEWRMKEGIGRKQEAGPGGRGMHA